MNEDQMDLPYSSESQKLTDWANEPTLTSLKEDFEAAKTSHTTQMQRIQRWNDLMKVEGKSKPAKVKGRSSVQPKLIRRQAEWRYSALSEPFLSSPKLFNVTPASFEDQKSARQNEIVLNWQFRTKMNRIKLIDDYIRSTVDDGTCIAKVCWRRYVKMIKEMAPEYTHFELTDPQMLEQFKQVLELKYSDPRGYEEQVPPEFKAAVEYYEESGQVTMAQQTGEQEVEVEKVIENRPEVEILNPANVYIDPSCNGDIDKALFVLTTFETNKAELSKNPERYKNLDKVNWESNTPLVQQDHETKIPDSFNYKDTMRKRVVAHEYWGFYDIEGNGELVPFVATWIGDTLIRMELNPYPDQKLPFVLVTYLPVKRELYGEPDAELLEENQSILGAVTRGMIDLMGRSANAQQGIAKGMLDPLNRRRFDNGDDYEYNPNINPIQGLVEHKFPEIPQTALIMSQTQNQEAEALTGVKSFGGGLSGQAYGDVAAGIRGMLDAASKREMAILRRLAKGMADIGTKIIAMNGEFLSEKETVRVTNEEFVEVFREDLPGNFDLEVDISTAEIDNEKAQDLGFMLQTIGPNMDPMMNMTILSEIADLKRMPSLAQKLRSWKPQPDPMQEELKMLAVEKAKAEVAEIQSKIALNQAKAQEALSNKDQKNLDFVEQETGTKHARDLEKQAAQSRGNADLQVTKALTTPRKEGESRPDVGAAIGFNRLSSMLDDAPKNAAPQYGLTEPSPQLNFGGNQLPTDLPPNF